MKNKNKREHLSHFSISGFTYYDGVLAFNELEIGTALRLEAEPENKYDARAVAIYFKDHKLGFVPRSENRIIYKLLEVGFSNFDVRVQQLDQQTHPEAQVGVVVHLVG
ncbi:HIRAN domain-containing protein [Mesonia ostreae]|uniref:HIRAN domain-containing protein n=1 Tax=Mesonia ostreae TaxID=861110 RepID=A0ABU2KIA9_9FLAO|nr:HIRAN domain-containing protein [Mesonia ostreae]MDT0294445.1 HIRAN domain-containing protein [Mesonia ostreae]